MESQRPRILVVDDNYATQVLLKIVLGSAGYELDTVSNASQGISYLQSGLKPALVILDLRMPEGDGVAFLEERSHSHDLNEIPVMILSGDSTISHVASDFGIKHYLLKGTRPSAIIDLVRQLVPPRGTRLC